MKISVIKIGGNVIDHPENLEEFLDQFAKFTGKKILVHGGGVMASKFGESLGVMPEMVDGRRITDQDTLDIVTMVYAGLINKNIVAKLQARGVNSMGMTGADGNAIQSEKTTSQRDRLWFRRRHKRSKLSPAFLSTSGRHRTRFLCHYT